MLKLLSYNSLVYSVASFGKLDLLVVSIFHDIRDCVRVFILLAAHEVGGEATDEEDAEAIGPAVMAYIAATGAVTGAAAAAADTAASHAARAAS